MNENRTKDVLLTADEIWADVLPEDVKTALLAKIPEGKLGEAQDIANVVAFLASDEAQYITGQTININGGMAMI